MILILKKYDDYEDMDGGAERCLVTLLTNNDFSKAFDAIQEDLKNMAANDEFIDLDSVKRKTFENGDVQHYCYWKDESKENNDFPYKTVEYFTIRFTENKVYSQFHLFFGNSKSFCYF